MPLSRPSTIPHSIRGVSSQQQRRMSLSDDEDIPALQSPSDSSESEDEPIPQLPRPTARQRTVPLRRPLANFHDSDNSDIEMTENDLQFARGLIRQFQEYMAPPPSVPAPSLPGNVPGVEPSSLLEALFLSSASEDEDAWDGLRSQSRNPRTNTTSSEPTRHQIIQEFVSFISNRMQDQDAEREPDHLRARAVIDGLEPVSKGLLSRYEAVRGEDHPEGRASCVVCYDPLDLDKLRGAEDHDPAEPIRAENRKLSLVLPYHAAFPEVVAFPCLHLFHSDCLLPWLAQKTTCPTCRFDVDPNSLTLKGGGTQRPWVPPVGGVLEAWVQAEEVKRCPPVKDGDRYLPLGSGYETDESVNYVESFRTCYEGEHRISES